MKIFLPIFTLSMILICSILVNSDVYALTYEPSDFKLINNPVICAFEPQQDSNISNVPQKMLAFTEYAFDDWKTKLTNGARNSEWDMTLIKVMRWQQNTFDNSQCTIQITYLPSPSGSIGSTEPVGLTKTYTDHTADIQIYYDNYDDGYSPTTLGTDWQLGNTLEHELGHAFGLNHVTLSEQEIENIDKGAEDMPSIMVPYVIAKELKHYSITGSDIEQLKSIYNYQGFGGFSSSVSHTNSSQQNTPNTPSMSTPALPSMNMTSSDISYWKPLIKEYFSNNTNKLPSTDYVSNVLNLVDVFDSEGLTSIPDPVGDSGLTFLMYMPPWFTKDLSLWANSQLSDTDLASAMQYLHDEGLFNFHLKT